MTDELNHTKTYKSPQQLPIEYDIAIDELTIQNKCSKPNCAFCDIMNREPLPPELFFRNGWSYSDLAKLESEYPIRKARELGEILNRSAQSIWSKAKELGLKKYNV